MQKLLLISILIATVALPIRASRDKNAARGFKRTVLYVIAFNVFYLIAALYIYPRLS